MTVEQTDISNEHPYAYAYWNLLKQNMTKAAAAYRKELLQVYFGHYYRSLM
jgi:hypothetical protein